MAVAYPEIGKWFRRPNGNLFEVVAVDEMDGTIEIQHFDGTIDEYDLEAWPKLLLVEIAAPEDWSGSVDMDPDDYVGRGPDEMPPGFHDPLAFLKNDS
ncbi:MAG: DUF6763 family protein [Pseudomonadota bacterium]